MTEKTDYSPFVEDAPEEERERERRKFWTFLSLAHLPLLFALLLAALILLVIYLSGGFGEGAQ